MKRYEKIFIDIDGVLADFDIMFEEVAEMSPGSFKKKFGEQEFWEKLAEFPSFFKSLPRMEHAHSIIKLCHEYSDTVILLTAPSKINREQCIFQKRKWVDNNFGKGVPIIFDSNKGAYSKKGRLLIDDMVQNCYDFSLKGGDTFLYTNFYKLRDFLEGNK